MILWSGPLWLPIWFSSLWLIWSDDNALFSCIIFAKTHWKRIKWACLRHVTRRFHVLTQVHCRTIITTIHVGTILKDSFWPFQWKARETRHLPNVSDWSVLPWNIRRGPCTHASPRLRKVEYLSECIKCIVCIRQVFQNFYQRVPTETEMPWHQTYSGSIGRNPGTGKPSFGMFDNLIYDSELWFFLFHHLGKIIQLILVNPQER